MKAWIIESPSASSLSVMWRGPRLVTERVSMDKKMWEAFKHYRIGNVDPYCTWEGWQAACKWQRERDSEICRKNGDEALSKLPDHWMNNNLPPQAGHQLAVDILNQGRKE